MVAETALYDTLGITPSASAQEIKTAYRKMALKYHPDKNNGDESAAEKFKKISEAYEILGDEDKRKQYDTYGKERAMNGAGGGPGFPSGVDPMDIFQQFFNFGGGGRSGGGGAANQARQKRKPKLTAIVLQCSLEELYCGTTKVLEIERLRLCPQCKGHGTANGKPVPNCRMCGGHGIRQQRLRLPSGQVILQQAQCSACRGTGKSDNIHPCPRCSSSTLAGGVKGVVMRRHRVQVVIEPGTEDSDSYSFPNEGDEVPNYDEPGDIIVVVEELAHPNFRRLNGNDLILLNCSIPLSFLFQPKCEIPVELLDGRIVRLAAPMLSTGPQFLLSSQHAFTVVGEGMPVKGKSGEKGKLVIVVHVRFPKSLSAKQQDQICSALGHQPQPHSSDVKEVILRPYHGETLGSLYVDPKSGNATNISPPKNKKDTPKQAGAKPRFAFASSSSGCQQQ